MELKINIHYEDRTAFAMPWLAVHYPNDPNLHEYSAISKDTGRWNYTFTTSQTMFTLRFKEGKGVAVRWEADNLERHFEAKDLGNTCTIDLWCRSNSAFLYTLPPRLPENISAVEFLNSLHFKPGTYVSQTESLSGLGATPLADRRILFGFFHPNAARAFVIGDFNGWQYPGTAQPDPSRFLEMKLYRGYFNQPNLWLAVSEQACPGQEYQFFVQGGVPHTALGRAERLTTDPYARQLGSDYDKNNAVIVDPTSYAWGDMDWRTPNLGDLVLYELSVFGFTEKDNEIPVKKQGKFSGTVERINKDYFQRVGANALSIMPVNEVPSMQGPTSLGYNPSLYFTVERDFGSPDEFRALVDTAHQHGLPVIVDQVFNHTSSDFNPLWKLVLEHPGEEGDPAEGGLYFSGSTPWGNRLSTERTETQAMLIDSCKLMIAEYHVDGFRFDFTHSSVMNHGFLNYLADELQRFKGNVLLIAENIPNEPDLNRAGFNGFAQWSNDFHDKLKALLREGDFEGEHASPDGIGDIFYFSKSAYASHTNNTINYAESHDEHSVAHEVESVAALDNLPAEDRKSRLGLFATLTALGQPMIYMGQEFNIDRPRNTVSIDWPADLDDHEYFQWASRLVHLRQRYPGLHLQGYNPASEGTFHWILGSWMDERHGSNERVIGWRATPNANAFDTLVVLINFENHPVSIDLELGLPGYWIRLASIDRVNDIPPEGDNSTAGQATLYSPDGRFHDFVLPDSSGFIFKWQAAA